MRSVWVGGVETINSESLSGRKTCFQLDPSCVRLSKLLGLPASSPLPRTAVIELFVCRSGHESLGRELDTEEPNAELAMRTFVKSLDKPTLAELTFAATQPNIR